MGECVGECVSECVCGRELGHPRGTRKELPYRVEPWVRGTKLWEEEREGLVIEDRAGALRSHYYTGGLLCQSLGPRNEPGHS